jgi:hypothetical protein
MSQALTLKLEEILRAAPTLMTAFHHARDLDLPDWLIVSGAVYQRVWNHLTGRDPDYGVRDYDRPASTSGSRTISESLTSLWPTAARPCPALWLRHSALACGWRRTIP